MESNFNQYPESVIDYNRRQRATLSSVAAMLQANAQMGGSNVPFLNSTYGSPMPYMAPNMFGQLTGMVGSVFGEEAGMITQLAGQFLVQPGLRQYTGGFGDMISNMMGAMPIGGQDVGGAAYARLQRRMGKGIPQTPGLPTDMSSQYEIDLYNERIAEFNQYVNKNQPGGSSGMQGLMRFMQTTPDLAQSANTAVQLANIQTLSADPRFQNIYAGYEALTNESIQDKDLADVIAAAKAGDAQKAHQLLQAPGMLSKAQNVIESANRASGMANFANLLTNFLPPNMKASDKASIMGLQDIVSNLMGIDKRPEEFSAAALQSLSLMGGLSTTILRDPNNPGRLDAAGDKLIAGLASNMMRDTSPYSATRALGTGKAGQLMSELAKSGILTTGGVDTLGAIKPEDVQRMEDAIAQQLEGFSEVAKAGRRMGIRVNEIVQTMQSLYGGSFARRLDDIAGQEYQNMRGSFVGPVNKDTDDFFRAEAQRKAGASVMQQVEKAVEMGRMVGLDARGSLAVMQTAGQLAEDLGVTREVGMRMGMGAMAMVQISREQQAPITIEQGLAMQRDTLAKSFKNPTARAVASLQYAAENLRVIDEKDPEYQAIMKDFNAGIAVNPARVHNLLLKQPRGEDLLRQVTSEAGVTAGMGKVDFDRYAALSESTSVLGAVKKRFAEFGVGDVDALTQKITSAAATVAENAPKMGSAADIQKMDFANFVDKFAGLDQATAGALLTTLVEQGVISAEERVAILATVSKGALTSSYKTPGSTVEASTVIPELSKEVEIRTLGAPRAVISAAAVVKNTAMLNEMYAGKAGSTITGSLKANLDEAKKAKFKEAQKQNPNLTEAEFEKQFKAQGGFTLDELFTAAGGATDASMRTFVNQAAEEIDRQIKSLPADADLREKNTLLKQQAQLADLQVAFDPTKTEAKRKELLSAITQAATPTGAPGTPGTPAAGAPGTPGAPAAGGTASAAGTPTVSATPTEIQTQAQTAVLASKDALESIDRKFGDFIEKLAVVQMAVCSLDQKV